MALYIRTLKKQPEVMHDWNDTIWTVMIEKAIVHKDGQITFVFQNGTEIKVGALLLRLFSYRFVTIPRTLLTSPV